MSEVKNVIGYRIKLKNRRITVRRAEVDGEILWQLETKMLQPDGKIYVTGHTYSDESFTVIGLLYAKISLEAEMAGKENAR